ncbi:unnamed protein product, partial [Brugia pahangi]|uniref:WD_REPEATS_REGION domain-containing protein n=1 Tax=Brugia pahangi TaxID=6280 RepID=A0A0N4T4H7_BRUPA
VYCLQYDDDKIISGLRDHTIKIWQRKDLQCSKTLHTGSVLYLQYDDRVIISGSSDTTVRHNPSNGNLLVFTVRRYSVICEYFSSKDRSIAVWGMISPREINVRRVLINQYEYDL